jgi:hypothetical protein
MPKRANIASLVGMTQVRRRLIVRSLNWVTRRVTLLHGGQMIAKDGNSISVIRSPYSARAVTPPAVLLRSSALRAANASTRLDFARRDPARSVIRHLLRINVLRLQFLVSANSAHLAGNLCALLPLFGGTFIGFKARLEQAI